MEYKIVYSDRRTISICVKNSEITVRAPRRTTEERIAQVVREHIGWINKQLEKQRAKRIKDADLTPEQIKEIKRNAKIVLKQKVEHFSKIMGLKYGRITVTSADTRFGSCSSKGNIAFSWKLMLYPEEAVDYVVVHELAHLLEMNHSPAFYAIVASVFPDYKARRALLKK